MGLNIIKGEEIKVNSLTVLLYGEPSTGKTSTALTASKPILFDFDGGAQRSSFKRDKDIVRIKSWKEIVDILPNLEQELAPYDTIIIDTVETCLDFIRIYIENQDYKLKTNQLRMYGKLKDEYYTFMNRINKFNKDVILIAHSTTEEKNGVIVTIPKITGGSKDIVRQKADFIGYMFIHNNNRTLNFNPTDYYEGKNSANFPVITLPNFNTENDYFSKLLINMKSSLQSNQSEADKISQVLNEFKKGIYDLEDPNHFNNHLQLIRKEKEVLIQKQMWALLERQASNKKVLYNKDKKEFYKEEPIVIPKEEPKIEENKEVLFDEENEISAGPNFDLWD